MPPFSPLPRVFSSEDNTCAPIIAWSFLPHISIFTLPTRWLFPPQNYLKTCNLVRGGFRRPSTFKFAHFIPRRCQRTFFFAVPQVINALGTKRRVLYRPLFPPFVSGNLLVPTLKIFHDSSAISEAVPCSLVSKIEVLQLYTFPGVILLPPLFQPFRMSAVWYCPQSNSRQIPSIEDLPRRQ